MTPHDVPARLLLAKACLAPRRRRGPPDATEAAEGVEHAEAALAALAASPSNENDQGAPGVGAKSHPSEEASGLVLPLPNHGSMGGGRAFAAPMDCSVDSPQTCHQNSNGSVCRRCLLTPRVSVRPSC